MGVLMRDCKSRDTEQLFGEPTIAGAILDRIIHNAHRIAVQGDSMRRKKGTRPLTDVENSETNTN
ncbi:hypothetical protein IVB24_08835 [Bradyrhizobium sp. 192]|nr:hypothetical protein IVB24_08835 [Bradyrhizobium sp. 192]